MPNGAKNWTFTLHYPGNDVAFRTVAEEGFRTMYERDDTTFIIVGDEICPTTQRRHFQGYIQFSGRKTLQQVRALFVSNGLPGTLHLEIARGNADVNITYCTKENEFVRHGEARGQGQRTDIEAVLAVAAAPGRDALWNAWTQHGSTMMKYHRAVESFASLSRKRTLQQAGFQRKTVVVFYGRTGAGKTRTAYNYSDPLDTFILTHTTTGYWWDSYDGESTVIIDEFTGNMPTDALLRILDGYPCPIATKGGSTLLRATTIFLTSNQAPESWYPNILPEKREAVLRRLSYIYRFYGTVTNGLIAQEKPLDPNDKFLPEAHFVEERIVPGANIVN